MSWIDELMSAYKRSSQEAQAQLDAGPKLYPILANIIRNAGYEEALRYKLGKIPMLGNLIAEQIMGPIQAETGTFGGPKAKGFSSAPNKFSSLADKLERFEIDDSGAKIVKNNIRQDSSGNNIYEISLPDQLSARRFMQETGTPSSNHWNKSVAEHEFAYDPLREGVPLGAILEHSDLFKQYPELKALTVKESQSMGSSSGSYGNSTINVPDIKRINKDTLLHEIQHAIQEKEGFARGGSPSVASWTSSELRPQLLKVARQTMDEWKPATYEQFWGKEITQEGQKAYAEYLKQFNSKEGANQRWLAAQEGAPAKIYKQLAGEIEARDVASRANLTKEQRARTLPYSSENIPLSDWIVRR